MKIGFVASCFDLGPHAGHMAMLEEASQHCDILYVGLHVNPKLERAEKNKPVQSVSERFLQVSGCRYVDRVIPYETESELLELLKLLPIDIRFLGEDYKDKRFTGDEFNMQLHFCKRQHSVSSSGLRLLIKGKKK